MKKVLIGFLTFLSFSLCLKVDAHNSGYARSWCGSIFYPRYAAWAEVHRGHVVASGGSYDISGRWIPTKTYRWNKMGGRGSDKQSGCSRPKSAYAEYWEYMNLDGGTGMNWFGANAGWKVDFIPGYPNGYQTAHWSNHSLLKPGLGEDMVLDDEKWAAMDKVGNTYGNILGDIELDSKKQTLNIKNLGGQLSIYPGSNFYATYKILIVKENMNGTDAEGTQFDEHTNGLVFENVVASGELNVTKSGVSVGGFLQQIVIPEKSFIEEDTSYGFRFESLNGLIQLPNTSLAPNEALTLIVYSDGGFDFTPALFQYDPGSAIQHQMKFIPEEKLIVYPNPADGMLNIEVHSATIEHATISLFDLNGRMVKRIFEGELHEGNNVFNGNEVKGLASGTYLLKVDKTSQSIYSKVIVK